jgi:hypothetical protein
VWSAGVAMALTRGAHKQNKPLRGSLSVAETTPFSGVVGGCLFGEHSDHATSRLHGVGNGVRSDRCLHRTVRVRSGLESVLQFQRPRCGRGQSAVRFI